MTIGMKIRSDDRDSPTAGKAASHLAVDYMYQRVGERRRRGAGPAGACESLATTVD